ncbi:small-conductance mechanosensitive channel [Terriglobus roseus DSM 18391]|uniref:Small-conductance mechanosensitive channel n=1 Tax=Terriglobus roseus (strain DSM 18391 / NRRL B-41598 / KBS 63) TaxID=926566 RepID=I3ZKY6_TERRK|nr:OFA family MFS transporter [Terriglobus roseus]AFL89904.1 small-conductance mechanosensitive channel [Terriglobus roseus DSM 18391]
MAISFLDRERSIAAPGFSRWLVPPAALAIHLSIGQVYAFSVFKNPLLALQGADGAVWSLKEVGYIFSIAIAVLGLSAAVFGAWLEKAGPRRAMFYAAICFGAGFQIAALGASLHSLALIYLGYGVVGGMGLGLGYISPVSTLIKWFPDRPGLSTGLAIMGFGGGALIGAPLGNTLMAYFKAAGHANPIPLTWITMGSLYFLFMMFGVFTMRVPPPDWKPAGYVPKAATGLVSTHNVAVEQAWRTPQFWLLWIVLCTNVTAGIGILEQAAPMIQDLFKGRITPGAAVGFVGMLSLLNMAGRFFWASASDGFGRKATYFCFFTLGPVLYFLMPYTGSDHINSVPLFVVLACLALSMYGGGFSTIPAYLKDLFGGFNVSAIHGRLLTAWSTAGIIGPLIVNGILDHYKTAGLNRLDGYRLVLYIMASLLVVGFIANLLVRPVAEKYWMRETLAGAVDAPAH